MISQNEQVTSLIEQTADAFEGGFRSTTATDGMAMLDSWIEALDENGDDQTDLIADILEDLKAELKKASQPDAANTKAIQELIAELISKTQAYMATPEASAQQTELQRLAVTLQHIHDQVGQ